MFVIGLAGCSSESAEPTPAPVPTATPTTKPSPIPTATPTSVPTATPTSVPTATPTPIVVVDALGQKISFDDSPNKIAAISPTATEMLYAAGGTSTLRDRASNFPISVQGVPSVGSAYNPSIEKIVQNKPDLILIEALTQARFVPMLSQSGLKVMAIKAETVDDIKNHIISLGKILGKETVASKAVSDIESKLKNAGENDGRSILLLIMDEDRNLYGARPESYTGLIASTLGLQNMAAGLPDSGPYPGFAMMSPESILKANPDIIVTITPAPEPAPRLSTTITRIPPFAGLKAIRNGSVIEANVDLFLQAPGPRIADAVEFLKKSLPTKP